MMELITLVEQATQSDARALGHLVTEHWRFVYTICLSQVGQAAAARVADAGGPATARRHRPRVAPGSVGSISS